MAKKILILGVMVIMALGLFAGCSTEDYIYKEGDFSLEISVDKTEVSVGDVVNVTIILKNLSGRDIPIKLSPWDTKNNSELKDLILIGFYPENTEYGFGVPDLGGRMAKKTIKKDATIQQTMEFSIEELIVYETTSAIFFHVGKEWNRIGIYSEKIKVFVKEN